MARIVCDNSALLPLFLSDEADHYTQDFIARSARGDTLIAPSLCLLEFGNGILKAVRQKRLTEAEAVFAHRTLAMLPIDFKEFGEVATLPLIHSLAQRRNLSFYDSSYLALVLQQGSVCG